MTVPASLARAARRAVETNGVFHDQASLNTGTRKRPQLRRYEVSTLQKNGDVAQTRHIAPALPLFENAFCAFSRGSLVETETGPVAIEDLWPGDRVMTQTGKAEPIMWKGSTVVVPGQNSDQRRPITLTRIMADSFGLQRPMSCVIAGPAARLLNTPDHLRSLSGGSQMLTPVQEFVDGNNVVSTAPPTPVELFHMCLPRHAVIKVGGLDFETYHPGANAARLVSFAMRSLFTNLFEHIQNLGDFGQPVFPRAGDGQIDALSA